LALVGCYRRLILYSLIYFNFKDLRLQLNSENKSEYFIREVYLFMKLLSFGSSTLPFRSPMGNCARSIVIWERYSYRFVVIRYRMMSRFVAVPIVIGELEVVLFGVEDVVFHYVIRREIKLSGEVLRMR
jgi:hypothetical protein